MTSASTAAASAPSGIASHGESPWLTHSADAYAPQPK